MHVIRQSSGDDSSSGGSSADLLTEVGNEIQVTLDDWSVGRLGWADLVAAGIVVAVGIVLAWLVNGILHRAGRRAGGAARTAFGTFGQLLGGAVLLLALVLALEVLGFRLGPVLILILLAVLVVLLLRPMITNLTSGLLLQTRGALAVGDLVLTQGELGVVGEITARTVVIDTPDGRRVHVPNSDVLDSKIVNYSSLGHRRSSFDLMIAGDEDLALVLTSTRAALAQLAEIHQDPAPSVHLDHMVGRLAVIRVRVWHGPGKSDEHVAIDGALRACLVALRTLGVEPDGPTMLELASDVPDPP